MTKVLLVSGLEYGVLNFLEYNKTNEVTLQDWVKTLEQIKDGKFIYDEDEELYFAVELFRFNDVDLKFVKFIRDNIQDYDETKDIDFFIVEE